MALKLFVSVGLLFYFISYCHCFKLGNLYSYEYETSILMKEKASHSKDVVGFNLHANVEVGQMWKSPKTDESIFKLKVNNFKVSNRKSSKSSSETGIPNLLAYIIVENNQLVNIYVPGSQENSVLNNNLIRGLADLVLGSNKDGLQTGVSGLCKVILKQSGSKITKIKSYCDNPNIQHIEHINEILVARLSDSVTIDYVFNDDGLLTSVTSHEVHENSPEIFSAASSTVSSDLKLNYKSTSNVGVVSSAESSDGYIKEISSDETLVKIDIPGEVPANSYSKDKLKDVIKKYKKYLKVDKLSKSASAKAFLAVLKLFRISNKEEILASLKENSDILPQLIDILGVTQTDIAVDSAFSFLKFDVPEDDSIGIDLVERYLLSVAISSHPSPEVLSKILSIAKLDLPSGKVKQSLLLTVGALVNTLHRMNHGEKIVTEGLKLLKDGIEACTEDPCLHMYLRAVKNARMASTYEILFKVIQKGGKTAVTALAALSKAPIDSLSLELKSTLKNILFEKYRKEDSTARILAADILLKNKPSQCLLNRLIKSLAPPSSEEISTYLLKRIQELSENDESLRKMVKIALSTLSVGNYNTLALKGLSVAMTNSLFASKDANATYGMHTELLKGGMLKSTSFDVEVSSGISSSHLVSVGAFATGLEAFAGEATVGESEPASCGMQITVLGVTLRPFLFFSSQSELMSLVWSGAGSEPTPALQGNFLLHDMSRFIILQNGFAINNILQGVVSTDLSGSVQISLWNRNAESVVNNKGAIHLSSSMSLLSNFAEVSTEYRVNGEASLDFVTSIDFYNSPSRMCMEMNQPPFTLNHKIDKTEKIPVLKLNTKRSRSKKDDMLGKSYALPTAIYKACASLKAM